MLKHYDYNDHLPSLSAKGTITIPDRTQRDFTMQPIPGRYFDPVSSRLDELSKDEYYRRPVPTWTKGRADFTYSGQKKGFFNIPIPNVFATKKKEKIDQLREEKEGGSGWSELKIWESFTIKKDSCYTNLPAKY